MQLLEYSSKPNPPIWCPLPTLSCPDPTHFSWHKINSSTRERWAPTWPLLALHPMHRSPPWLQTGQGPGHATQEGCWEGMEPADPHYLTALQNWATSDATDILRAKRNTSSSSQVTDTRFVAFISCSKPQHSGFFLPSDKLLKFADPDFCVALQQLTQQWCWDHQIARKVFLNWVQLVKFSAPAFLHKSQRVSFPLRKPIIERSTFFKEN